MVQPHLRPKPAEHIPLLDRAATADDQRPVVQPRRQQRHDRREAQSDPFQRRTANVRRSGVGAQTDDGGAGIAVPAGRTLAPQEWQETQTMRRGPQRLQSTMTTRHGTMDGTLNEKRLRRFCANRTPKRAIDGNKDGTADGWHNTWAEPRAAHHGFENLHSINNT